MLERATREYRSRYISQKVFDASDTQDVVLGRKYVHIQVLVMDLAKHHHRLNLNGEGRAH
jgi:hypothetical protein